MERVVRAVYEGGVLKPLSRVRIARGKVCLVSIYPEEQWRKDFEALRSVRTTSLGISN
jgi:predicted DNA-binding antitoxin AbrB/MazE fold protein